MAWNEALERHRARIHQRAFAYRQVFGRPDEIDTAPWWALWRKPTKPHLTPAAEVVLRDLARYCYAQRPTLTVSIVTKQADPVAMAFAEGRRDVFNRITALLNLDESDIERIAHQRSMNDE